MAQTVTLVREFYRSGYSVVKRGNGEYVAAFGVKTKGEDGEYEPIDWYIPGTIAEVEWNCGHYFGEDNEADALKYAIEKEIEAIEDERYFLEEAIKDLRREIREM